MNARRLRAALAVAACALLGLAPAAPAGAAPSLAVTAVQTSPGRLSFQLAATGLPAGGLADARVTVAADGVALPATVTAAPAAGTVVPPRVVVLVMDVSGSMAGPRLAAARAAAVDYAAAAPPEVRLGLVTVADTARTVLPPTGDRTAFRQAVARLTAGGDTMLFDGVARARDLLDPQTTPAAADYAERRVVVLSDGADSGSRISADALAAALARSPVVVDAVRFGEASDAQLRGFTTPGGGRVVPASDGAALRQVLRGLAAGLGPPATVTATVPAHLSGRAATLTVQATAGDVTATATAPVQFRVDTAVGAAPATFEVAAAGPVRPWHLAAAVGLGLFLLTLAIVLPLIGRSEVQQRLHQLDRFVLHRGGPAPARPGHASPVLQAALSFSEQVVRRPDRRERMELALDRAGSSLRPEEWLLIRLAATAGGAVLGMLALPWWAGLPVGAAAGWLGTGVYLRMRATRRSRAFADQLPEALQLVVGSLRSGFSLHQSIDALVREAGEPVAGELGRALAETQLGGDLEDALERVGERNASQDMAWLVMAIRIQREVGGNLAETLETAVETMRERGRLFRHVRALSAEGRLSALVLLGMPVALGGWMFFFRNDYVRPLYTEPLGIAMLVGSVLMVALGGLWLRKLVQVEV